MSSVLLECPEQDCSKKYKHANGLRYHQSHAHGSISSMDEDSSSQAPESPQRLNPPTSPSPGPPVTTVTNASVTVANLTTSQTPTKPPEPTSFASGGSASVLAPTSIQSAQIASTAVLSTTSDVSSPSALGSVVGGSITTGIAGQPVQNFVTPAAEQVTPLAPIRSGEHPLKGTFLYFSSVIFLDKFILTLLTLTCTLSCNDMKNISKLFFSNFIYIYVLKRLNWHQNFNL